MPRYLTRKLKNFFDLEREYYFLCNTPLPTDNEKQQEIAYALRVYKQNQIEAFLDLHMCINPDEKWQHYYSAKEEYNELYNASEMNFKFQLKLHLIQRLRISAIK